VIASNNLAGIWPLRDRRCVAFSKLNHTCLIYASKALKDQPITDKGLTLRLGPLRLVWACLSMCLVDDLADVKAACSSDQHGTPPVMRDGLPRSMEARSSSSILEGQLFKTREVGAEISRKGKSSEFPSA
jgi:hypothetical protein